MARLVSEGRKREFAAFGFREKDVPDPEDRTTFERSKLNWQEVEDGNHREMLEWVRSLIHLRRTTPALNDGDKGHTRIQWNEEDCWLVMDRGYVRVVLNLGNKEAQYDVPEGCRVQLASREGISPAGNKVTVPADTIAILSPDTC
jgi:maltooligosyltrehalose trehalohydrolase